MISSGNAKNTNAYAHIYYVRKGRSYVLEKINVAIFAYFAKQNLIAIRAIKAKIAGLKCEAFQFAQRAKLYPRKIRAEKCVLRAVRYSRV